MNIVNDSVTEYLNGLYRPLNDNLMRLRKTGEDGHIPIILPDSEGLLVQLIKMKRPKKILEIGTAIGYSAAVMATAAGKDAQVTTIEIDPLYAADAEANLAGYGNVSLVRGDATKVLSDLGSDKCGNDDEYVLHSTDVPYDLIFIDAAKSHYMEFWNACLGVTTKGSVIVCDNVLMKGMTADSSFDENDRFETNIKYMRRFLAYITNCKEADTAVLPVGDGMCISVIR